VGQRLCSRRAAHPNAVAVLGSLGRRQIVRNTAILFPSLLRSDSNLQQSTNKEGTGPAHVLIVAISLPHDFY
jgi:hypothetical protein